MLSDFQKHIKNKFSFLNKKKLLVAISGGLDSVVLSHLLYQMKYDIAFAHCNFHLRGNESDQDENIVVKIAKDCNIKCFINHFNTIDYAKEKGQSIQMAARELRYAWFNELIQKHDFDYLLTAHHLNDNLETFLINLSRGTGLEGLTGIPEINQKTIRPLLVFTKIELENFAIENNLIWREDQSNSDTKYLRNKIRHEIIPILNKINPNFMQSFSDTISHLEGSDQIVKDRITNIESKILTKEKDLIKLDIQKLKKLAHTKSYLYEFLKSFDFTEWNDIYDLLNAQSGKQIYSKTHRLIKDRDYLLLVKNKIQSFPEIKISKSTHQIKIDSFQLKLNDSNLSYKQIAAEKKLDQIIYIDKDLLIFPLQVRKWQKGDYFYPLGMQGKKKLSKYFKDEKLSLVEKENIWLLCSENKIVWVLEHRSDERFKVTEQTKKILKVEIKH